MGSRGEDPFKGLPVWRWGLGDREHEKGSKCTPKVSSHWDRERVGASRSRRPSVSHALPGAHALSPRALLPVRACVPLTLSHILLGRAGQGRLIQPPPEPSQHPEQAAEPDQTEGSARPPPKLTLAPSQLPAAKFQRWLCWMEKQKQDGRKDARLLCHLSLSRHLPRSRQCIPLPLLVLFEHGEQWGRRGAEPSS